MSRNSYRFLRPYLSKDIPQVHAAAYARFFSLCSRLQRSTDHANPYITAKTADYQKRVRKLEGLDEIKAYYPRIDRSNEHVQVVSQDQETFENGFTSKCMNLKNGEIAEDSLVEVNGKVLSARRSSSKLTFVTIRCPSGDEVQGICDIRKIEPSDDESKRSADMFSRCVRKGDWISIIGHPYRSDSGEASVLAKTAPSIVAPSLNQIPDQLEDQETLARHRHVDLIVNRKSRDIVLLRHAVESTLQDFLNTREFIKVSTPILNAGAGGAVAQPFKTAATELPETTLDLRIAPELFLKRLIVGGLPAVYEIGPAFRNEGVDATHNPEFTICEFYKSFASLDELVALTQHLFCALQARVKSVQESRRVRAEFPSGSFASEFHQLEFIPCLETRLREVLHDADYVLPNLSQPEAQEQIERLFIKLQLPMPARRNLPKLLDALAGHFIEPLCKEPTFIKFHPSVMSPLSKSFVCPKTNQLVSARAELFIGGVEYANMYEEENSPFEQRRKFEEQLRMRGDDGETSAEVDESYIEALEWGMPPTGGWGCGVDRIVMLFAGTSRIADVLPFGTLRNVVSMTQNGRTSSGKVE